MAVYYNNILCVSSREMCAGIVTYANLNKLITRKKVDVVKRGGGEDNPSLIRFDNLPERLKGAYVEKYGNPKDTEKYASFTAFILIVKGKISFSKNFLRHITLHTIGTARGIIYSRTESTPFSMFILPPINVEEAIKEDVNFPLE